MLIHVGKISVYRDVFFLAAFIILHLFFLFYHQYPLKGMMITGLLYMLTLTGTSFPPGRLFLVMAGKERQKQKGDEVIDLYLLLSNAYQAENNEQKAALEGKRI